MTPSTADRRVLQLLRNETRRAHGTQPSRCVVCEQPLADCVCWCPRCDGDGCQACRFTGAAA